MIGDAKIIGLSEGQHAAAEPLVFRNRLFKHLVVHSDLRVIALESGILEGRVLNDYVMQGKGEFETVLKHGFSNGFDTFQQNRDLIRWMRDYNAQLPVDREKVQVYGLDVPGSPGNFDAARGPDTALQTALEYLQEVDPTLAAQIHGRVASYLPVLKGINGYGDLTQMERDTLTAAIADLVSLMERQELTYVRKSSREDFDWAERAAIGARQVDTWFRHMPLKWKLEHGLEWTREAMQVRDRVMADNFEWLRTRLGPSERVLIFAASGHLASTEVHSPSTPVRDMVPLGTHLEDRYGSEFVNILNLIANGEIKYCSASPRRIMTLKPPPESAIEAAFSSVKAQRYVLDMREAPPAVSDWLQQPHDHFNGFVAYRFATAKAFDLVYFVRPLTSACVPE
jgi:erythromycin esterase